MSRAKHLLQLEAAGLTPFLPSVHGSGFTPPLLGAEFAKEYQGTKGGRRAAGAFWSSSSSHAIILVVLEMSKHKPVGNQLEKIAKTVVPAFGL